MINVTLQDYRGFADSWGGPARLECDEARVGQQKLRHPGPAHPAASQQQRQQAGAAVRGGQVVQAGVRHGGVGAVQLGQ